MISGTLPSGWILLMQEATSRKQHQHITYIHGDQLRQAWLMQAWVPTITEKGLQMQSLPQDASSAFLCCRVGQTRCWFLSCLVVYWTCFPTLARHLKCAETHVCEMHHGPRSVLSRGESITFNCKRHRKQGHFREIGTASFCASRFCLEWLHCAAFQCFTC